MRSERETADGTTSIVFAGLHIAYDDGVLRPRPWTVEQSRWGRELLRERDEASEPGGPVLELCAGAGHIGLAAVAGTGRHLVMVERDAHAAVIARRNAQQVAETVEVRVTSTQEALAPGERFDLIVADPPWVRRAEIARFPHDPTWAIDGGTDGLDLARACLDVIGGHLADTGAGLLQLGTADQARDLEPYAAGRGVRSVEVRTFERGVVVRYDRIGDG